MDNNIFWQQKTVLFIKKDNSQCCLLLCKHEVNMFINMLKEPYKHSLIVFCFVTGPRFVI